MFFYFQDSINEKREKANKIKEDVMRQTLKEMKPSVLKDQHKLQIKWNLTPTPTHQQADKQEREMATKASIHCRSCSKKLFELKDLRFRDPNYICVSREFRNSLIREDHENMIFYCAQPTCNFKLGRHILMRGAQPLLMIDIKGIKFDFPGHGVSFKTYSQWKAPASELEIQNYL